MIKTNGLRVGCVVMAAGSSQRFGGNKLEARLEGKTLLQRALNAASAAALDEVVVVSRGESAEEARQKGFRVVLNDRPGDGLSRTVRLGTEALADCDGILYLVADQPLLSQETVERVVTRWRKTPASIVGASHDGKRGNPCIFPRALFGELKSLTGDCGGTAVIRAHADLLVLVETAAAELSDVDTPETLAALQNTETSQ